MRADASSAALLLATDAIPRVAKGNLEPDREAISRVLAQLCEYHLLNCSKCSLDCPLGERCDLPRKPAASLEVVRSAAMVVE